MPELPEVNKTVVNLKKTIVNKKITNCWSDYDSDKYKGKDEIKNRLFFNKFKKVIIDQKITDVSRRGKNILINLSNNKTIHIHLKMTGHLLFGEYKFERKNKKWVTKNEGPLEDPFNQYIHFIFMFSDGTNLAMSDMRKFGKITLFETVEQEKYFEDLGPEPFDKNFTSEQFQKNILKKPKRNIKTLLMDQEVLVGVGNIYSDEALFLSKIHPETKPQELSKKQHSSLLKNIRIVMEDGVDLADKSRSDYRTPDGREANFREPNNVYRRTGNCCSRKSCSGIIERKIIDGRSGHFCPICQVVPKA